ncbi:3-keto-disaccharide hydrolase [Sphingomonas colocasiae]|uniref:DUF1080 domain-containing protein n=1 Tax=Sphingomonas colocasiae TaxID=1848973 RepID=A0ABS7PKZ9_9SPHN|nr:DUF1080 domain-containing protein [Sphingomonas colocasiae]MBY8820754.1 DUF1080 domain-containing protein [Sphingomonas colocasiae]
MRRRRTPWPIAATLLAAVIVMPLHAKPPGGFTPLFDGKTLKGWRGDPALWSVRDGTITGGSDQTISKMSFLIHDGDYADFELHFRYRFPKDGNSGFQFRSATSDQGPYMVAGYQANVVPPDQLVRYGMLYDNLGRNEIALLSERVEIGSAQGKVTRTIKASVNPVKTVLAAYRPYPAWNDYVVIAHGDRIAHAINGQLVLDAVDTDPARATHGLFALQIDFGKPMWVQFKDIAVKRLKAAPRIEGRFASMPGAPETTPEIPRRPPKPPQ